VIPKQAIHRLDVREDGAPELLPMVAGVGREAAGREVVLVPAKTPPNRLTSDSMLVSVLMLTSMLLVQTRLTRTIGGSSCHGNMSASISNSSGVALPSSLRYSNFSISS